MVRRTHNEFFFGITFLLIIQRQGEALGRQVKKIILSSLLLLLLSAGLLKIQRFT